MASALFSFYLQCLAGSLGLGSLVGLLGCFENRFDVTLWPAFACGVGLVFSCAVLYPFFGNLKRGQATLLGWFGPLLVMA